MNNTPLAIIILAAGKGTRMKSGKAKVLHELFYNPMVVHVVKAITPLNPIQTIAVVGHQKSDVEKTLQPFNVDLAVQQEQLGTGHAVLAAEELVSSSNKTVMILCGDTPLIKSTTLEAIYKAHIDQQSDLTLVTTILDDPTNYGRVLSDDNGNLLGIVEQKDATERQLKVKEINAGIYCVDSSFLFSALKKVGTDNKQGEVYLTDIVKQAVEADLTVKKYTVQHPVEVLGVNSRLELSEAQQELQLRRNRELMALGVSMISPETIRVAPSAVVNPDVLLEPCVHIDGETTIDSFAVIEQGAVLKNCTIGSGGVVGSGSHLENTIVGEGERISPLTRQT